MKLELRLTQEPWLPMIIPRQHNCARLGEWTIAVLEMGVECQADAVCLHKPPRHRAGVAICHPAYEIRKEPELGRQYETGVGWWLIIAQI